MSTRSSAAPLFALALALAGCLPVDPPEAGPAAHTADGTGACLDDEPRLIHYARWLATDPDPQLDAIRRRYHLEMASASEVEQVTDAALCLQARSAYADAFDLAEAPDAVAVIRIGERYIVTRRAGTSASREFASAVVFDRSMRVLSTVRR